MKGKNQWTIFIIATFFVSMLFWNLLAKTPDYSESERRVLARMPELTWQNVIDGDFAKDFDDYVVDHFPARDWWRSVKVYAQTEMLRQKDSHGIYTAEGHISKMEYPMNKEMIDYAVQLFNNVREQHLLDNKIYLAVIPDKNRFLAERNGYLAMDYEMLSFYVAEKMPYASYIEIADLLEAEDYYTTDSHWRQEKIVDVAERISEEMGVALTCEYEEYLLEVPFKGVYAGQSSLKCEADTICYLENDLFSQISLEGAKAVYDKKKAEGKDPYEMFLSGNQPIVIINNPTNESGKRLVMFRDSFGSSIAPLFIEGYSEIVLVDLRYLPSNQLGQYVDFEDADVLFLYSTMMLNQSRGMR